MDARFAEALEAELEQIRTQGLWKEEWPILGHQGAQIRVEGRSAIRSQAYHTTSRHARREM